MLIKGTSMALLNKFLKKTESESLFPQQTKVASAELTSENKSIVAPELVMRSLIENKEFIRLISDSVTQKLLEILSERYDFTPTDKYLKEISNRKKYISQLDSYLQERKEINNTVETELQTFLQETSVSLAKALEMFTMSIQNRIKQAESRHGIDSVKELLCGMNNEKAVK
ncbi:MAG: hypothetical protein K0R49_602 [Burkholderiales bacterium]|jgi:hypothetical protein|nr:hypothetical protein [Burkholderiales bacterium]